MVFKNKYIFRKKFGKLKLILKTLTELCLSFRKDEKLFLNDQNLSKSSQFICWVRETKIKKICSDLFRILKYLVSTFSLTRIKKKGKVLENATEKDQLTTENHQLMPKSVG